MTCPRSEYPRPQFVRADWLCLNGAWQFEIDHSDTGIERGWLQRELEREIQVPFCPESPLSGIGYDDFMAAVWYRREVTVPAEWAGRRVVLHFQAVDYDATVWVNGTEMARHRGGFTPFSCDITDAAAPGTQATIVVRARDPKGEPKPHGKQQPNTYHNAGCSYTRTTGIWQTVWLEPVAEVHMGRPRITPQVANRAFQVEVPLSQNRPGTRLRATLGDAQGVVATVESAAHLDFCASALLRIPEDRVKLWGPGAPHLYDLKLELVDASAR